MARRRKNLPPPPDDGHTWVRRAYDRELLRGDVLRVLQDDDHPEYGWLYAWCSGNGFGTNANARGHAIYVVESTQLEAIRILVARLAFGGKPPMNPEQTPAGLLNPCRWESYWPISVLEEEGFE